jgi:BirA family biotin operon repressor/biotin-[acetyl-CoA-carboxylase] ligase
LRTEWEGYHAQQNLPIQLNMPNGGIISGIGRGASVHGELLLETAQGMRSFHSGEVGAA